MPREGIKRSVEKKLDHHDLLLYPYTNKANRDDYSSLDNTIETYRLVLICLIPVALLLYGFIVHKHLEEGIVIPLSLWLSLIETAVFVLIGSMMIVFITRLPKILRATMKWLLTK